LVTPALLIEETDESVATALEVELTDGAKAIVLRIAAAVHGLVRGRCGEP
jgi:hypothetical protein